MLLCGTSRGVRCVKSYSREGGGASMDRDNKKCWKTPELTVFGTVEDLTHKTVPKRLGTQDDFGISGISSP
jgi:hypothetical protein